MRYLFTILLLSLVLLSCHSGNKSSEKSVEQNLISDIPEGSQALFDGNTLSNWEITNFGTQGPVRVSGGKIIIGMGEGCSGITWTSEFPKVNYEVGLEAMKTSGNDFFCGLTFPVKDNFCSLIVGGWGGPVVGLSIIDGLDASENETQTLKNFEKDVWYFIHLRVTEDSIVAWVDDEKLVDLACLGHQIGIRPEVSLSRPFGVCTWMTSAEIRNVWLKEFHE